ncbi:hypothetical protein [Fusobacterium sp. IOR10]|uniref:hypothetical protein n=1 Tax=Fusobacterium sp. IOR10 TaxID=2665157 RepID=UPI0013CF6AFD|nr:hypothetical protein [Fusobacterium sp. IOR10]
MAINKIIKIFELDCEIAMDIEFSFKEFLIRNFGNKKIKITQYSELNDSFFQENRSESISLLGICSFILDYPLSFFDVKKLSREVLEVGEEREIISYNKMIVNDIDYSSDLDKLIKLLANNDKSILTVLDRFRKGLFMECESTHRASDLYNDEAILIYFNIIEFLAEKYGKQFSNYLELNIEESIDNFYVKAFYLTSEEKKNKKQENLKLIKSILLEKEKTVKNKILFMLNEFGICSNQLNLLISDFVKNRNNIAHGNVYNKLSSCCGQSFFNLELNSINISNNLKTICKLIISKHFQLNEIFKEDYLKIMPVTKKILKDIIKNPTSYKLKNMELINSENNINYEEIYRCYIAIGGMKLDELSLILEKEYLELEVTEEIKDIVLEISTILADSNIQNISNKAKENIEKAINNNWVNKSDLEMILEHQIFYGVKSNWLESYIKA